MKYGQDNIRVLNDLLRTKLTGGVAVMTPGVAALGAEAVNCAIKAISVFNDFCVENDPYGEHDFGAIEVKGHRVFFKIDYFDKSRNVHSPDPSDPDVTERVLTIMLADEY